MPKLDYDRRDLVITVYEGQAQATFEEQHQTWPLTDGSFVIGPLLASAAFQSWQRIAPEHNNLQLVRICLDVRGSQSTADDWERLLSGFLDDLFHNAILVRTSSVRPRCANFLFSTPLRILRVNRSSDETAFPGFDRLHRGKQLVEYEHAFTTGDETWTNWNSAKAPAGWPNIDILHIEKFPELPSSEGARFDHPAWLIDQLIQWQVRLLVIQTSDSDEWRSLGRFAGTLIGRGGPAVIVEAFEPSERGLFYGTLYADVIHDRPLDWAWRNAAVKVPNRNEGTFFGGALREEQLRISRIARLVPAETYHMFRVDLPVAERPFLIDMVDLTTEGNLVDPSSTPKEAQSLLSKKRPRRRSIPPGASILPEPARVSSRPSISLHRPDGPGRYRVLEAAGTSAAELLNFNHESSFLRVSRHLSNARAELASSITLDEAFLDSVDEEAHRFCNSSFWEEQADRSLKEMDQASAIFHTRTTYQLGVQIGPRDNKILAGADQSFIPEVIKWTPEMQGTWIEIGITGIDFEVIGDPVQKVWLSKDGPTEMVYFAIAPHKEGTCRLRFALYYEQNVIQSFRVAVIVGNETPNRAAGLALALGLERDETPDVSWLPMLEFSLASSIDSFAGNQDDRPQARALSILVNDWDGESIITVKGSEGFHVNISERLPAEVRTLRETLDKLSSDSNGGYPFDSEHQASPEAAGVMFRSLADRGNHLFLELFDSDSWQSIWNDLSEPDRIIQISQVLREKVIPWSFIYDRPIFAKDGDRDEEGRLVNMPVCFAALPDGEGKLTQRVCGHSPQCLLNTTDRKAENVICPLHFWGYRHLIEIPPMQVKAQPTTPESTNGARRKIPVNGRGCLVAGFNGSFATQPEHLHNIEAIEGKVRFDIKPEFQRSGLLRRLSECPIHMAYFFCHAEGGEDYGDSRLIIQSPVKGMARESVVWTEIASVRKGDLWSPPALVFLNGCGTASFSPKALSPFLRAFIDQLGASGMVGTEISVWDVFAAKMAESFLLDFFDCIPAGAALLKARRKMLAKRNPLGLAYTLFAWNELQLVEGD